MTDFKHVEEQIARLKDANDPIYKQWPFELLAEAAKTMQALLDENRLLRAEHQAGKYISRNSPNDTWETWVHACDAADTKPQLKATHPALGAER